MGGYWNGDEWRWRLHKVPAQPTISVIDGPDRDDLEGERISVPFGFGIREPQPERPDIGEWEGNPS